MPRVLRVLLSFGLLLVASSAGAHPFSASEARLEATADGLRVTIEVLLEDLFLFHDLAVDDGESPEADNSPSENSPSENSPSENSPSENLGRAAILYGVDLHGDFLLRHLHVLNSQGVQLQGGLRATQVPDVPPDGIPMTDLMKHALEYELFYPWEQRPGTVTVMQDFGGATSGIPAVLQLRTGDDLPVVSVGRGYPCTLRLGRSGFDRTHDVLRHNRARIQFTRRGRTVHERITIPLHRLRAWFPERVPADGRNGRATLSSEQLRVIRQELLVRVLGAHTLHVDGIKPVPELIALEIQDGWGRVVDESHVFTGALVIHLSYDRAETVSKGSKRGIRVKWELFGGTLSQIHTELNGRLRTLSRFRTQQEWVAPPRKPTLLL